MPQRHLPFFPAMGTRLTRRIGVVSWFAVTGHESKDYLPALSDGLTNKLARPTGALHLQRQHHDPLRQEPREPRHRSERFHPCGGMSKPADFRSAPMIIQALLP
jgi:hypothetical protein